MESLTGNQLPKRLPLLLGNLLWRSITASLCMCNFRCICIVTVRVEDQVVAAEHIDHLFSGRAQTM
eukprot:3732487-Amphidinium_carterae.1